MNKLAEAIKEQGVEPCRGCKSEKYCADGRACKAFLQWTHKQRIVGDIEVWERQRRLKPQDWIPTEEIYNRVFPIPEEATASSKAWLTAR
jgi:hypothetical protein